VVEGLIGRKVAMTQLFAEDGSVIPCTVLRAGPCVVVQRRDAARDGYEAVQLGFVDPSRAKRTNRPLKGHFDKAGLPPPARLREFRLIGGGDDPKVGDTVAASLFKANDRVDIIGVSKGKGFQGVMKRHHFRGGAASHGSMFHRAPGSIGSSAFPSRVFPGMRMAGRMGGDQVPRAGARRGPRSHRRLDHDPQEPRADPGQGGPEAGGSACRCQDRGEGRREEEGVTPWQK
jgi:large subunit ribosomal protein L3